MHYMNLDMAQSMLLPELTFTANDLLVFIDDTGNELFAGDQGYYGLGGSVVLGAGYGRLKEQWKVVRSYINGSPEAPLHASDMSIRKPCNFAALSKFFLDRSFARIAVATLKSTVVPKDMHPAVPVMGALQEDIATVASLIPCTAVLIIGESSQRADPMLRQRFRELKPAGAELPIPVQYWLMPKRSAEPGLEVADFIISAAGSQIQRHMRGEDGFAPDFHDVFCQLPSHGCLFSLISEVEGNHPNQQMRMQRLRLTGNTP
jgi:hypothetical protein